MGLASAALLVPLMAQAAATDAVTEIDPAVWTTAGARIPSLELPRIDGGGETVDLADLRGRKLLLVQFASW